MLVQNSKIAERYTNISESFFDRHLLIKKRDRAYKSKMLEQ